MKKKVTQGERAILQVAPNSIPGVDPRIIQMLQQAAITGGTLDAEKLLHLVQET